MKHFSLQRRSAAMSTGLFLSSMLVLGLFYLWTLVETIAHDRRNALLVIVAGVENALSQVGNDQRIQRDVGLIIDAHPGTREIKLRVWRDNAPNQVVVNRRFEPTQWQTATSAFGPDAPDQGTNSFKEMELPGETAEWELIWSKRNTPRGTFNILVAHSDASARTRVGWMLLRFGILLTAIMILGAVGSLWLVRSGMAPIKLIGAQCEAVDQGRMSPIQIETEAFPIELDPFIKTLNHMLARLEFVMARQRQFVADASHELRTPLAVAKSSLQLAAIRERSPQEYRATNDDVLEEIERIERMLSQLLELARLDAVEHQIAFESLDLEDILTGVVRAVRLNPKTQHARLELRSTPGMLISGNRDHLTRLFYNLIENAVVHGPADEKVTVTQERYDGCILIKVHDAGGGIPAEALPHLFDRFFRVDPARSRTSGGSGLGLAIAGDLAKLHGARLEVSSQPETGTVVRFILPD